MSKKTILIIVIAVVIIAALVVGVLALTSHKVKNIEGTLEEIMARVYTGIPEEELPMMLSNIPVTTEDIEYYVGTSEIDFKEAIASESMTGSIPHSIVLVRLNDAGTAQDVVAKIMEKADPRKWICVEAENVTVKSKGDLVILIMSSNDLAQKVEANFDGLE